MVRRCQLLPIAGLLFSIGFVSPARAEVITVTAGEAVIEGDGPAHFTLFGADGFALGGVFVAVPTAPHAICFNGCAPGTSLNFSAMFGGPFPGSLGSATLATIQGMERPPFSMDLTGTLAFDAPTVVLPGMEYDGESPPTAPFVFRGHVAAFDRNDVEIFQVDLTGQGTATVSFHPVFPPGTEFTNFSASYTFASPAPIPEPASIFLLGTGLVGLMRRKRITRIHDGNAAEPLESPDVVEIR
jgi:hypothetical protein